MLEQEVLDIITEHIRVTDEVELRGGTLEATPSDGAAIFVTASSGEKFLVSVVKIEEA